MRQWGHDQTFAVVNHYSYPSSIQRGKQSPIKINYVNTILWSCPPYGELTQIPNLWETKNRENTRQRKQSHSQDNIYVVRQFAYVHRVVEISLLSGKNTEYKLGYSFLLYKKCGNIIRVGLGHQIRSNKTRLHKTQQISHLETSSITNINRNPPKHNPSSLQLILLSSS